MIHQLLFSSAIFHFLFKSFCHVLQRNAIQMFNLLNLEGRSVTGAFLPVGMREDDELPTPPPMVRDL